MNIDWNSVFVPAISLGEIMLRGSIMYLGLFAILRFMGRRQAGTFGPADLLVIVLIADAAQNGLGKEYGSVTEGLVLVMTIVAWEWAIDWVGYHYPATRPWLQAPGLELVRNGKPIDAHLRKEMISDEELHAQLREREVDNIAAVKVATLEGDGRLSVLKHHAT
ncbi:MAG: DUF421 domain-containing protein [Hyphomicrobiaceae bacterium]|nr:DUF421 domain-containing protein [Hyphomicrobiaceae bacterium]